MHCYVLADKENIEGYAREKLNKKFFQIMLGKLPLIILTIELQAIKSKPIFLWVYTILLILIIEVADEKWKLSEQTRKFNKMRPFEQADYKKKHPNFEPVRIKNLRKLHLKPNFHKWLNICMYYFFISFNLGRKH